MKRILLFAAPLFIGACNTLHSPASDTSDSGIGNDSIESKTIYSDSIDNIIQHPSDVRIYKMLGLVRDSAEISQGDTLFNYAIESSLGKLSKNERILLGFVMGDNRQFRKDYTPIRQPFNPDFALEFIQKKLSAFCFVSFGTGEIAIADRDGQFKFYLMHDSYVIERWYEDVINKRNK